jgi:type III restriction enzyme
LQEIKIEEMNIQTFHEGELKKEGMMFYDLTSMNWFKGDQKAIFEQFVNDSANYEKIAETITKYGVGNIEDLEYLRERIVEVDVSKFKTPLNVVYVSYEPERQFLKSLLNNVELFEAFIKNPSKSFYAFPYSYKPETKARTHVKQDNFNPDFFLKKGNDIIVVEIKKDGDDNKKNKAKYRDGSKHFNDLNRALEINGNAQRYYFKFLSPTDYVSFFEAVRNGKYREWKSSLMNQLKN